MRAPQTFLRYIDSMRCVTRNPPKMFTLREHKREEAEGARQPGAGDGQRHADRKQRADDDHRRDRVRDRHERGVQRRRHRPDDVIADEDREHEDREPEHGRVDGAAGRAVRCRAERRGGLIDIDLGSAAASRATRAAALACSSACSEAVAMA